MRQARLFITIALVLILGACGGDSDVSQGQGEYDRGVEVGFKRGVEAVAECAETAEPGQLDECLLGHATFWAPDASETYLTNIGVTGLLIETEFLVKYAG